MDNLEEMEKFLEKYKLPKLNQEEIDNLNRPITSTEIETVIENFPTNKSLRPDSFTGKFYQTFREELSNLYPSETVPKSCREKKTSQFIS